MAEPAISTETASYTQDLLLEPADNERLANLCGPFDEHLRQIEERLGVAIGHRGNHLRVSGNQAAVATATAVLKALYESTQEETLAPAQIHLSLQQAGAAALRDEEPSGDDEIVIRTRRGLVRGRGPNQQRYLSNILHYDINFGVGPAGTGKTFLAVARAVEALEHDLIRRLVLVRPAVEAGERLGFLPGDLVQKIDPYLRPLYDALYEMLGFERVAKLLDRNVIEIAPLAFMRGRTLNESFIILDEAENTTAEQMKMFLTRIGFGSTAVVTGDITQVDLPRGTSSGLKQAIEVLRNVEGISIVRFDARDVVRHPLVQSIVDAYARFEQAQQSSR